MDQGFSENNNIPIGFTPSMVKDIEDMRGEKIGMREDVSNEVKNLTSKSDLVDATEKQGTFPL